MSCGRCSLPQMLKRASNLARCDAAIRGLMRHQDLSISEKQWVLDMFNMSLACQDGPAGDIAWHLFKKDQARLERLLPLSRKIDSRAELTTEDWKTIEDGLVEYRHHLICESQRCQCY